MILSGSIRERAKGHWEIRIDLGRDPKGHRLRRWATFRGTKKGAIAEKNRLLEVLRTGTNLEADRISVSAFLDRWINDHVIARVSRKTLHRYREICELHIKPRLGHIKLAKLQPLQIQSAYADMLRCGARGKPLAARTVLHHHRVLRQALQQALRWRLIQTNAADLVQPPRPTKAVVKTLADAEAKDLLESLQGLWVYVPSAIALHAGLRRGEILALRWSDVDFEKNQLSVQRSVEQVGAAMTFRATKTGKGRQVAMSAMLARILRTHKARQAADRLKLGPAYRDEDLVCAGPDGRLIVPHKLSDAFRAAIAKLACPKVTFHGLRHTHATILLRAGVHPKVVSERLGHSTVGITLDVYSHVVPGMQEKAAQAIDRAFGAAQ